MEKVIAHPNDNGSVAITFFPSNTKLDIHTIAEQAVPAGKPYRILDKDILPEDHTFFNAWYVDFSVVDGYGKGA